jgi:hypothetical protein
VSGHFHVPAALPLGEIAHGTHWIGDLVGSRAGLDAVEEEKNLTDDGNLTLAVQHVARHYTD